MNDDGNESPKKQNPNQPQPAWGSDLIAEMMRALGLRYIALNPGSSYRGLHDSLVNHLGDKRPQILLCLHEEHAVSIAHGWAKVTGEPMAVALHANVGLMHASMAIYNAWCDRVPIMVFGAAGPYDASLRRPWIDWIHTSRDQAAIVRPYTKWDDQPMSIAASLESMNRASVIARTAPMGPVYVAFDVTVQEQPLALTAGHDDAIPSPARYELPAEAEPNSASLKTVVTFMRDARSPLILMGRVSRDPSDWARRVALAEAFDAKVITDIKTGASFPTNHALHVGDPGYFLSHASIEALKVADCVISFDWIDLAGTLRQAGRHRDAPKVVQVSLDHQLTNGWSFDHQALAPADLHIAAMPDTVVAALVAHIGAPIGLPPPDKTTNPVCTQADPSSALDPETFAAALGAGLENEIVSFVRLPLGWLGGSWHFKHPLDYLGCDGGAGIGAGPGMLVGAALAMREGARLPIAVLGDGDFMMGVSALWTGAHNKVPFLIVVANNQSFFNDEIHQGKIAQQRNRPIENKWIGQRIAEPDIDIAGIAQAQGLIGIGPVATAKTLTDAVLEGVARAKAGASVVIDARVLGGYGASMSKGMTKA
ncbi:thiamine pyrophosphate-binding protein [Ruegeria hyattellae]|uniref:thiamine pyrophosphate-binding protein n=1 Tax=Ruegeria hyattellae TaxID=3233337 RepID=UPI00355B4A66